MEQGPANRNAVSDRPELTIQAFDAEAPSLPPSQVDVVPNPAPKLTQ